MIGETLPIIDEDENETDLEAEDGISDAPPIKLVNSILVQAGEEGAGDIHFLPRQTRSSYAFRSRPQEAEFVADHTSEAAFPASLSQ